MYIIQAKGQKKQIGWFPKAYVKVLGSKSICDSSLSVDRSGTPPVTTGNTVSGKVTPVSQQQQETPVTASQAHTTASQTLASTTHHYRKRKNSEKISM